MNFGLMLQALPILEHNFTDIPAFDDEQDEQAVPAEEEDEDDASSADQDSQQGGQSEDEGLQLKEARKTNSKDNSPPPAHQVSHSTSVGDLTKALIHFIAARKRQPLWQYEDITSKVWSIRSAGQLDVFLQHVLRSFELSLPATAQLAERWAELALQLALNCSSRHYAGRSLQIFRALRVPITSRMLSDILSRLVETIAEQGEDMQGYVTELILTLESVVDALDSDIRPMDHNRDIFKSTPNLKDMVNDGRRSGGGGGGGGAATGAVARKIYNAQQQQQQHHAQVVGDRHQQQHQQAMSPSGHG